MVRKKKSAMEKEVERTETPVIDGEQATYGEFPKIASKAVIKQCTLKKEGPDIRFDNLSISSNQAGILQGLIESGDTIMLTIEVVQGNLPYKDE